MNVRQIAEAAGVVLVLVTSVGWYRDWRARAQAEARIEEAVAQAARDSVQNAALTDSLRATDSLVAARTEELNRQRAAAERASRRAEAARATAGAAVTRAGDSLSATLDSVEVVAPELGKTAHVQLDTLQASHNRVVDAFQRQLRAQVAITAVADSSLALCTTARSACDDLVAGLRREIESKDAVIARQDEALNPGFLSGLFDDVPKIAVSFGLGVVACLMVCP